jgi:hypothetical protein
LLCPLAPLFVHGIAFVDRGVVEHDDTRHGMGLAAIWSKKAMTSSRVVDRCCVVHIS